MTEYEKTEKQLDELLDKMKEHTKFFDDMVRQGKKVVQDMKCNLKNK